MPFRECGSSGPPRARTVAVVAAALLLTFVSWPGWAQRQDGGAANVLVVHSNQRATPAQVIIEDTLRDVIAAGLAAPVQVFSEYLDDEWTSTAAFAERQAEFLRERYRNRDIRVVVADALPALLFLRKYRAQVAPDVPVVYLAVAPDRVPPLGLTPRSVAKPMSPGLRAPV